MEIVEEQRGSTEPLADEYGLAIVGRKNTAIDRAISRLADLIGTTVIDEIGEEDEKAVVLIGALAAARDAMVITDLRVLKGTFYGYGANKEGEDQ